jgi:hypothetical protein
MTKPVPTPATCADIDKVLPHLVAEIIHGVLEAHPRRPSVIASEAKQSRPTVPRALTRPSGLLRRCAPRNDDLASPRKTTVDLRHAC